MNRQISKFNDSDFRIRIQKCIDIIFEETDTSQLHIPITFTHGGVGSFHSINGLKFNRSLFDGTYYLDQIDQIILHEVIHYLIKAKGYSTEYSRSGRRVVHGQRFKMHCRQLGCTLDGASVRLVEVNPTAKVDKLSKYTVKCTECDMTASRNRASNITNNPHRYHCKCGAPLQVIKNY